VQFPAWAPSVVLKILQFPFQKFQLVHLALLEHSAQQSAGDFDFDCSPMAFLLL
jgi:hypothetical protein